MSTVPQEEVPKHLQVQKFRIEPLYELRIEVANDIPVTVKLVDGIAEIFGTELARAREYKLPLSAKLAMFTWQGANVEVVGAPTVLYVAENKSMPNALNIHHNLERQRVEAETNKDVKGPRIMIAGPTDAGKSTLCKILANYATRKFRKPIFVDLDVGQGQVSLPTSVAATVVDSPLDLYHGFSMSAPLVFSAGSTSPSESVERYRNAVERLAQVVNGRLHLDNDARVGGLIVNTCGWIEDLGFTLLKEAAKEFDVDRIMVLGSDKLESMLKSSLAADLPRCHIVKLTQSGGAVQRSREYRISSRTSRIKEYFYGPEGELSPQRIKVPLDSVKLYSIGKRYKAPAGTLPADYESKASPLEPEAIAITTNHLQSIFAVPHATSVVSSRDVSMAHVSFCVSQSCRWLPLNALLSNVYRTSFL
uniref:Protein CLP1 homolog n=1 Tax=Palpitomonas bilix TaxID=652834 RepID=A0A7S3D2M0_9EUKA|mmetsp:Transcript_19485/g.49919  ORF Transcript_19485/g.49919 Transcript_19485/m.49919 type:complete len:420 (+) Transcript_19485:93-1352(+)